MFDDATKMKWEGRWDMLKGALKEEYGDMVDDAAMEADGKYDRLIGKIKAESGKSEEEIEAYLERYDREHAAA